MHYRRHFSGQVTYAILNRPYPEKTKWLQLTRDLRNRINETNVEGSTQQQRQTMYEFLRPANPQWQPEP